MKIEEKDSLQIKTSNPDSELDTSIAFLQVPTKIKDRVTAFINDISDAEDRKKLSSEDTTSPFQSNGCFFVVSLEKIENIHAILKKALDPNEDNIDKIRAEVSRALTALQGQ